MDEEKLLEINLISQSSNEVLDEEIENVLAFDIGVKNLCFCFLEMKNKKIEKINIENCNLTDYSNEKVKKKPTTLTLIQCLSNFFYQKIIKEYFSSSNKVKIKNVLLEQQHGQVNKKVKSIFDCLYSNFLILQKEHGFKLKTVKGDFKLKKCNFKEKIEKEKLWNFIEKNFLNFVDNTTKRKNLSNSKKKERRIYKFIKDKIIFSNFEDLKKTYQRKRFSIYIGCCFLFYYFELFNSEIKSMFQKIFNNYVKYEEKMDDKFDSLLYCVNLIYFK